jgi:uncharacterized protein (TIGR03435 family)
MKLLPVIVLTAIANAQPAFEVASVKSAKDPGGVRGGCHGIDSRYTPNEAASAPPLGRCVIRDGRLGHIVRLAFNVRSMQVIKGGPDWVMTGDDRFNIEAKAEDPTKATEEQLLQMLQALVIERFNMKFHRESKEMPGYAMVVGKNGPKFKEAKGEEASMSFGPNGKPGRGPNSVTMRKYSMSNLADLLTNFGNPIVDKTGLTGYYEFTLSWDEDAGPTLYTALQEQLGLKLEPEKVPVSFIVIESAQKPSEN